MRAAALHSRFVYCVYIYIYLQSSQVQRLNKLLTEYIPHRAGILSTTYSMGCDIFSEKRYKAVSRESMNVGVTKDSYLWLEHPRELIRNRQTLNKLIKTKKYCHIHTY